jgi:hypothetical protein
MLDNRALRNYVIGAVIVWVGIIVATAVMLGGSGEFGNMLIILAAGAIWFVLLVPGWLRTMIHDEEPH